MSQLQNFLFENQEVRFVGTADDPEWLAVDVCKVLELGNPSQALSDFDEDEKGITTSDTLGGLQGMLTVTEPGLYKLIFKSRKPVAKRFQKWVFSEVLPSLRKTGTYSVGDQGKAFFPILQARRDRLEIIQLGMDLLSQLGGMDERTEIQLKDLVRDIVLADSLKSTALSEGSEGLALTSDRLEWTLSDRVVHLGYKPQQLKVLTRIGKAAASLYRARYGTEPPKKEQYVDGATRMVNLYTSENVDVLDSAIKQVLDQSQDKN
jgi:hypothetical protein